jgi:hypothetical protein
MYHTPSHVVLRAYDALPREPRRDEQDDAAASGTTSAPDQTAARNTIVES